MMYEVTYSNDEITQEIDALVGKSFSFMDRLKMRGIGSKRMMIDSVSKDFMMYLNTVSDINYANISLRPNGIIVYINKGLKNFAWPIVYYKLSVYNTQTFGIYADGNFIKFKKNVLYNENRYFIGKLLEKRIDYLSKNINTTRL